MGCCDDAPPSSLRNEARSVARLEVASVLDDAGVAAVEAVALAGSVLPLVVVAGVAGVEAVPLAAPPACRLTMKDFRSSTNFEAVALIAPDPAEAALPPSLSPSLSFRTGGGPGGGPDGGAAPAAPVAPALALAWLACSSLRS